MSSIADLKEMRKALCAEKETLWTALNKYDEICYNVFDEDNQLEEYRRVFQSSLKIMHQCVTNFSKRMDEQFDKMVQRKSAEEAYLNHRRTKEAAADGVESIEAAEENDSNRLGSYEEFDDFPAEVNVENQDDLPNSEYEVTKTATRTNLVYKDLRYGAKRTKNGPGMDLPSGKYRCRRLNDKCTGTVEPIAKLNGKVHIRECDKHSCGESF